MKYLAVVLALVALAALGCGKGVAQNPSTASLTVPSTATTSSAPLATSQSTTTTNQVTTTAVSSSQGATNTWTNLNPSGALPSIRAGHSMVYDSSSNRVIMFGGLDETNGTNVPLNDTWAYDPPANTWTNLNPSGTLPSVRVGDSMAYDTSTHRAFMFGGVTNSGASNDTWAYDPSTNTWTNLSPTGAVPSARAWHKMVYDSDTGKLIMFGGLGNSADFNDTWAYDPSTNTWTNLSPTGAVPSARDSQAMVYDPSTHRVILFGGFGASGELNDTWAYDPAANTWTKLSPSGTLPPARFGTWLVYDPSIHQVIMFGGEYGTSGALNDTWAYDPAVNTWTKLSPSGTLPAARTCMMVYDSANNQVILFGGNNSTSGFNDTWSYHP